MTVNNASDSTISIWRYVLAGAVGFTIGGAIGYVFSYMFSYVFSYVFSFAIGGAALGTVYKDVRKMGFLAAAGAIGGWLGSVIGFGIGGVIGGVIAFAIGGATLGVVQKDVRKMGFLAAAGAIGGVFGYGYYFMMISFPISGAALGAAMYYADLLAGETGRREKPKSESTQPEASPTEEKKPEINVDEILAQLEQLKEKDPDVHVDDINELIAEAKEKQDEESIKNAENLIKNKSKLIDKRRELMAEFEDVGKTLQSMSMKLGKGEISDESYRKATEELEIRKIEIQDELGEIDYKLYKEEYEKPVF